MGTRNPFVSYPLVLKKVLCEGASIDKY